MSLAADAIQPFIVSEFRNVRGRLKAGALPDLVLPTAKYGFYVTIDDTNETVTIDFGDQQKVIEAIASDCSRFASAAFQTINPIEGDLVDGEKLSWALIQLYYSAFYAGHSISRLFGESFSFLDGRHCAHIRSIVSSQGLAPTFSIDAGLYRCTLIPGATGYSAKKVRAGSGGVHEAFWHAFVNRLRQLQVDIGRGPLVKRDAQTVIAKLAEYEDAATRKKGMTNWLSSVRNEIQYRHGLEVWVPCGVRKQSRSVLGRLAAQWCRDPIDVDLRSTGESGLPSFVSACAFLPALCLSLLQRLDDVTQRPGRSFAFDGALSYANNKFPKAQGTSLDLMTS